MGVATPVCYEIKRVIRGLSGMKNIIDRLEIYDRKKEAVFYESLKMAQSGGHVLFFHRQPKFDLPGGITYSADFQVFYPDGTVKYIDVKGKKTKGYIRNKKMVESLYPVEIEER